MSFPRWKKVTALALAALCSAANFCLAVSLYSLWRSSKRDAQQLGESEWEGLANAWGKSINALGGLTAFYFLIAAVANAIGFVGMLKRSPRFVRLWRDFAIADLACTTTAVVAAVYASSRYMDLRNNLCEELSRHDDMMMDLAEMGITLENCEQWSQRVVFAVIFFLFIVQLVRLYLVFTTSSVFARMSPHIHHTRRPSGMKRIYIMPGRPNSTVQHHHKSDEPVVYMPIPLSELTERERQRVSAREAWIATSEPSTPRSRSNSRGSIGLPIQPGEGLLPTRREKQ